MVLDSEEFEIANVIYKKVLIQKSEDLKNCLT